MVGLQKPAFQALHREEDEDEEVMFLNMSSPGSRRSPNGTAISSGDSEVILKSLPQSGCSPF